MYRLKKIYQKGNSCWIITCIKELLISQLLHIQGQLKLFGASMLYLIRLQLVYFAALVHYRYIFLISDSHYYLTSYWIF